MNFRTSNLIKNIINAILTSVIIFVGLFLIVGIIFNIVYIPAPVSSFSMYPTLNKDAPDFETVGDYAYLNKFADFNNNDIVIAEVEWYNNAIIKRLVASPNDILQIKDQGECYALYVNEKLIYTKEKTDQSVHGLIGGTNQYYANYLLLLENNPNNVVLNSKNEECFKLQDNQYFLMGDNWAESLDCTTKGPVTKNQILGRVDFVIYMNENKSFAMFKQMIKTLFAF